MEEMKDETNGNSKPKNLQPTATPKIHKHNKPKIRLNASILLLN